MRNTPFLPESPAISKPFSWSVRAFHIPFVLIAIITWILGIVIVREKAKPLCGRFAAIRHGQKMSV